MLQNLANKQKFGVKEEYMGGFNKFAEQNLARLQAFFTQFINPLDDCDAAPRGFPPVETMTVGTVPDGFVVLPPPPVTSLEKVARAASRARGLTRRGRAGQWDSVAAKQPSAAVERAAATLSERVARSFPKLCVFITARSRERATIDMGLTEGELKAAELLVRVGWCCLGAGAR